jgi:hypothetical protein
MRNRRKVPERGCLGQSGTRIGRVRVLLAHDPNTHTCDPLCAALRAAFGDVEILDASSVENARTAGHMLPVDVTLVCLDLPPAPLGGVRLAQETVREGRPVVLVTRSLRWLPPSAADLRALPWVTPEAPPADVARAIGAACELFAERLAAPPNSEERATARRLDEGGPSVEAAASGDDALYLPGPR